jgi:formylmethanofuran:tetrahydromethanopterin formyltransferase
MIVSGEQVEAALDAAFQSVVARYRLTVMPTMQAAQAKREAMATRGAVLALVREGLPAREVSDRLGMHISYVYLIAREAGVPFNGKRGRPRTRK